VSYCG